MSVTGAQVLDALRPVVDPELVISVVDLGLIRGITVDAADGTVQIELTLTSPMCPLGPQIIAAVRAAAESLPDVSAADVQLVWSPLWDPRVDATEDGKAELGIWD